MEGFSIEEKGVVDQMRNVLKLTVGEEIYIGDGKGKEAIYRIENITKSLVIISKVEDITEVREPENMTHLYLAILKADRFELAIEKATELGVTSITPIITARTVKKEIRRERLEKIILEAAEQSGRQILPKLYDPILYLQAINQDPAEMKIFFDSEGGILENKKIMKEISLYIGPEGGWTEEEMRIAQENNFQLISLGKTTLRAETAVISVLAKIIQF